MVHLRWPQSRSASPRTSVAQHWALPYRPEQGTNVWRCSSSLAGAAMAETAKMATEKNFMLTEVRNTRRTVLDTERVSEWMVESMLAGWLETIFSFKQKRSHYLYISGTWHRSWSCS
jgi:hypothetical protein